MPNFAGNESGVKDERCVLVAIGLAPSTRGTWACTEESVEDAPDNVGPLDAVAVACIHFLVAGRFAGRESCASRLQARARRRYEKKAAGKKKLVPRSSRARADEAPTPSSGVRMSTGRAASGVTFRTSVPQIEIHRWGRAAERVSAPRSALDRRDTRGTRSRSRGLRR
jgi:hypothetical protein